MPVRRTLFILLLASLVGALLSVLLLLQHYNQAHDNALLSMICGGNAASGCEAVDESAFSSLFGVPLSAFGIFFYLAVALSAGLSFAVDAKAQEQMCSVLFGVASIALAADVALLLIQAVIIGAFCTLCLSTYAITLVTCLLLLKYRSFALVQKIKGLLASPAGKVLAAVSSAGVACATLRRVLGFGGEASRAFEMAAATAGGSGRAPTMTTSSRAADLAGRSLGRGKVFPARTWAQ